MQVTHFAEARPGARAIAVGTFDGVHVGHRAVIGDADTVLTFDPHPVAVVAPSHMPRLLTPLAVKIEIIESLGVSEMIVIDFDSAVGQLSAEEFVDRVLVERLSARRVAVGENFRFGRGAKGSAPMLVADPRFEARVVPLLEVDGEVVSSSHIRSLIAAGEVARATRMLGAPFELRGIVVGGDRRGRELGFPTANLVPQEALVCPGHGIYACLANGHPAAVSIGVRPTFETGRGELIEAHLIDFDGDLYGTELRLRFLERLRGERRFADTAALIEAMHEDVKQTRVICASATVANSR